MRTKVVWFTAVLLTGFMGFSPSHAQDVVNLLDNGGFETGDLAPWETAGDVGSVTTVVDKLDGAEIPEDPIEGNFCLHVNVQEEGPNAWDSMLKYNGLVFEEGKIYTLSAFIKSDDEMQVRLNPQLSEDPYTAYGAQTFTTTNEWQEYYITTPPMTETVTPANLDLHFNYAVGEFWIDAVRWYEGEYVEPAFKKRLTAKSPIPEDGAVDVPHDTSLSWEPGPFADTHNVYFGDNFDDVNNADTTNTLDVLVNQGQISMTYNPESLLEFGQTYYWRIDEVNAPQDSTVFKGDVWSFTVEPLVYPIANITATASSSADDADPADTINGSGLDADDLHSMAATDMWLSAIGEPGPTWIQYEFDRAYKLTEMWVWNYNVQFENFLGFGFKNVTIEHSVDGVEWTALGDYEFVQSPGQAGLAHNTTIDLGGLAAQYIRLTANTNWATTPSAGLSEVRIYHLPVHAREPQPASGDADVALDVVLEWRAGREAASHEVSFNSDRDAIINGTAIVDIATENRYEPGPLEFGQIYYWKVNEVNEAASPSSWEGDVWSFSTIEYFVVDDFEDYNDFEPDRIFDTWIDGWGVDTNGAEVGYANPDFPVGEHHVETTIVHGGAQSMPYSYDNNFKYSEAVMTLSAARNWTQGGVTKLSLWFYGDPNNTAERMYVALNGSAPAYHDDPAATQKDTWTEWTIDLQEFADQGVDLTNVNTIAIGFGDKNNVQAGGSGMMFFDDIRVGHPVPGQDVVNLLDNGGFETGDLAPWVTGGDVGSVMTVVDKLDGAEIPEDPIEGDFCLHIIVQEKGENSWDSQLKYNDLVFEAGKIYTLSAFIKSDDEMQVRLNPQLSEDPYTSYGAQTFTTTNEWQEYYITTPPMTETVTPANLDFHFNYAVGEFWIDGVRFYEGDYVPPDSTGPSDVIGDFEGSLDGWWAGDDFALSFSTTGATLGTQALQVDGPGGWHMDALLDLKPHRASLGTPGATITADVTAFDADMTTTWMQVEMVINAQSNDDAGANNNIGWQELSSQDVIRDGQPHTYTWVLPESLTSAIAGADDNIGWFELALVTNLDGASVTKFYIDNIQLIYEAP